MPKQKHNVDQEVRSLEIEFRTAESSRRVEGYAALFGVPTDMGWYTEVIARTAFDNADLSDVRCLFNHNADNILARSINKTLTLTIDDKGLKYGFDMPNTNIGNDLFENIRLGNISQSSYAFVVKKQTWTEESEEMDLRTIEEFEIVYDVSPVTYPANSNTDVALRSKPTKGEEKPTPPAGFSDEVRQSITYVNTLLKAAT
ncbi:HK97 family phage prohead protease [Neolewinella antarctica]|uniref:Prohead serine protease domain-containing protein n=1 Tax=Neolewinella antarctica TaxID=442734 RepID=A0ABX0X6Z8_9BACT|nr:HK97 family phage prohead protease [Neolewinella antarctica]NJC24793.1 hypothetical protein [Neolewinella antarctica]